MELQKGKGGAAGGGGGGKLLVSTLLDAKDELEERLERCVGIVTSLTSGLSEREANDALNAHICKGTPQHEEICLGLFTLVLTEPAQAQKCYRDLALVSRDGMNIVLNKINQILMEKYLKLQDTCRTQLVWLLRELVKSGVLGADGVCMTFMKQIAGGDVTAKNIWLAENVLEILTEQSCFQALPALNVVSPCSAAARCCQSAPRNIPEALLVSPKHVTAFALQTNNCKQLDWRRNSFSLVIRVHIWPWVCRRQPSALSAS